MLLLLGYFLCSCFVLTCQCRLQEWEKSLLGRRKEEDSTYKLKLDKRQKEEAEVRQKLEESRKGVFCW